jgi:hypothetical protein
MQARIILKRIVQGLSLVVVFLPSGRITIMFTFFAQLRALIPDVPPPCQHL